MVGSKGVEEVGFGLWVWLVGLACGVQEIQRDGIECKKDENWHHIVDEAQVHGHRSEPSIYHSRRQLQHLRLLSFRHHHWHLRQIWLPRRGQARAAYGVAYGDWANGRVHVRIREVGWTSQGPFPQ